MPGSVISCRTTIAAERSARSPDDDRALSSASVIGNAIRLRTVKP
jgi:hypothetical protein